jgi:hypothetical protein
LVEEVRGWREEAGESMEDFLDDGFGVLRALVEECGSS